MEHLRLPSAVQMVVPQSLYKQYIGEFTDEQFYFMHLLVRKMLETPNTHDFIHLGIRILEKQLGRNTRTATIQPLIDLLVIEVQSSITSKESYSAGGRSKGFRLNEILRDEVKRDQVMAYWSHQQSSLARRLKKNRIEIRVGALKGHPRLIREYDWLCKLTLDRPKAEDFREQFELSGMRGNIPFSKQSAIRLDSDVYALSRLKAEDFLFTYNGIRLTTVVTVAMREIRKCLMDSKGNHFIELDLRSSQIVFLCKALALTIEYNISENYHSQLLEFVSKDVDIYSPSIQQSTDIAAFIRRVLSDDIYSELYHLEAGYSEEWIPGDDGVPFKSSSRISLDKFLTKDRGLFKKQVLSELLFNYYTRTQLIPRLVRAFEESYPNVVQLLKGMASESKNWKKSADLAEITQAYESYFFHTVGLDALVKAYPTREFYLVHDSVGAPEDIAEECQQILNKALERHLGIPSGLNLIAVD
jgi:hypothetical protein